MSTLASVLKNDYIGPIREQLNNATVLLTQLKKSTKEVVGSSVVLPLHTGRNWGIGARGTTGTGTLPTARNQQYKSTSFATKDVYGRVQFDGKTIRATKTDKGAFLRAATSEIEGMTKDLANDINRQLYLDGSGTLATYASGTGTTTITVDSTQYLQAGMYIDFNAGGGGSSVAILISSVDSSTVFTAAATVTAAGSDPITLSGVGTTDELNGLALITNNTGTLEGITTASYSEWKGNVYGNDSAPVALTQSDMQQVIDACDKKGGKVDFIITSHEGRNAYINILSSQVRFSNPAPTKLKGGFEYIDFNGIPITVDKHCQSNDTATRMFFLSMDTLKIYRMADFDWMQEDGNILARQVGAGATESYEATLVCDMEFATTARRQNGILKGILPV